MPESLATLLMDLETTFRCRNCGEVLATSEKAETDWIGQSVLFLVGRSTVSPVCAKCARQVRWVGRIGMFLIAVILGIWLLDADAFGSARDVGASQRAPATQETLEEDEIAVMAVALDAAYTHAAPGWVLVSARTATFECNPPAPIGLDIGGCTGMRVLPETSEERLALVRQEMPAVTSELAAELLRKNQRSIVFRQTLPAKIDQVLWSPDASSDFKTRGNPTFAAYFSRVALDTTRARALIYLATMNWTDRSKSMGQYLYLEKQDGRWIIKAHAQVWG